MFSKIIAAIFSGYRPSADLTPDRARRAILRANGLSAETRAKALARFDRHIARNEPPGRALHVVMAWAHKQGGAS